ncbi:hypothetical protein PYW08_005358 [Mythimna loreyi]|uniref:Uncharacterized protein n=1 Tax=Mythimna loreyi TaxID=667449 RepID=A0ACC2QIW7_9NEOP|nr:hypothetical protein PYW08_005358 [Mythimna loreyi]
MIGRPLVWDATCVDTLAPSHFPSSSCCAGAAAAENLKRRKYTNLVGSYIVEPFGVETPGSWGPRVHKLFNELFKRLVDTSSNPRAGFYLRLHPRVIRYFIQC